MNVQSEQERRRVGATVRALREKIGATQDQFANRVGMTRPTLANIEAGRRNLSYKHLPSFAEALGVPPIAIMWPEPNPQEKTAA
ncbi:MULTISPECIES: helix-turn-helix domain-containing protein [Corynebacterium]|uniref:helix-turn-helix domain-containing protein n=1 Tax=Corynebacterium TaxID=1716 RepID=UPI0009F3E488|nr:MULTISPECIES: helix-turn-helix transcriptional regulator [unclassified Corynebacterium]MBC6763216.1 XRE family transcriptional regulator [Corynebacterium sp. LK27]